MAEDFDERNFDSVENAELRAEIDPKYNTVHDMLTAVYYNCWKNEISFPYQGYDKLATPELSKERFDILHGLIFTMREKEYLTRLDAVANATRLTEIEAELATLTTNGYILTI